MLETSELSERFSKSSDSELYRIYSNLGGYTPEAKTALNSEIEKRGGIEELNKRIEKQIEKQDETLKIENDVELLFDEKLDKLDIEKKIHSDLLSQTEINAIIERKFELLKNEKDDEKIKPKTLVGGIFGSIIGSILGGILWGIQLIFSAHFFYIFIIGLAFLSYGFIYLFTRQSYKNIAVLVLTAISVVVAIYFGFYLYSIFGYRGYNHY